MEGWGGSLSRRSSTSSSLLQQLGQEPQRFTVELCRGRGRRMRHWLLKGTKVSVLWYCNIAMNKYMYCRTVQSHFPCRQSRLSLPEPPCHVIRLHQKSKPCICAPPASTLACHQPVLWLRQQLPPSETTLPRHQAASKGRTAQMPPAAAPPAAATCRTVCDSYRGL